MSEGINLLKEGIISELDILRQDLKFQLDTPEELDWDHFYEIAKKAKEQADLEDRNYKKNS